MSCNTPQSLCPCGGIILADTEDWKVPLCHNCYSLTPECAADAWARMVGAKHGNKQWVINSHRDAFMAGVAWLNQRNAENAEMMGT